MPEYWFHSLFTFIVAGLIYNCINYQQNNKIPSYFINFENNLCFAKNNFDLTKTNYILRLVSCLSKGITKSYKSSWQNENNNTNFGT